MGNDLRRALLRLWPVRALIFLVLRPKRFADEFIFSVVDYRRFRRSVAAFRAMLRENRGNDSDAARPGLLIVAGNAMNAQWCQLWAVLGGVYKRNGHEVFVLTSRIDPIRNFYFRLFD